ncbi:MAG: M28 family peptidase [bacterium]
MRLAPTALIALTLATTARAQDIARSIKLPPPSKTAGVPNVLPIKFVGPATTGAITPLDLMTRLYKFADDSMMGRLAGTVYNDKGTDYIAAEVKRLGLEPAGENGGYFQSPLIQRTFSDASYVGVGDKRFTLWKDFAPRHQGDTLAALENVPVVFGGTFGDTASYLSPADVAGKIVLIKLATGPDGRPDYSSVNRSQLSARFANAAAVAVAQLDWVPPGYVEQNYSESEAALKVDQATPDKRPPYFYVTDSLASTMLGAPLASARNGMAGVAANVRLLENTGVAPGRNVLAILPGSDPKLRGQYVAIGAHNDHVGFNHTPADHDSVKALMMHAAPQGADSPDPKPTPEQWAAIRVSLDSLRKLHPARTDSIYNGADDDGSGSMALLEIAERFATSGVRPKRSIIFAWHVGEEEGMLGSGYFTDHPTVPRDSVVAQLNIDMIGRGRSNDATGESKEKALLHGGPGYLQLIGSRRLSSELGDMVEKTNAQKQLGLKFDYALDANGHQQNIYCRSDHYSYARWGIPIVFFTTGGHADYHQVTDEPQYIDYRHMSTVATLVHATAVNVANLGHRPVVDKPKPDPRGTCQQ